MNLKKMSSKLEIQEGKGTFKNIYPYILNSGAIQEVYFIAFFGRVKLK